MFESLSTNSKWPLRSFSVGLRINKDSRLSIEDLKQYRILGVTNSGAGVAIKRTVLGSELTMREYQRVSANQLMWCKVDTKNGAFGVTKTEHIGSLASPNMCLADIDLKVFDPRFLQFFLQLPVVIDDITTASLGTTNRQYLKPQEFLDSVRLRVPPLPEQRRIVARIEELAAKINEARGLRQRAAVEAEALITAQLRAAYSFQAKRYGSTPLEQLITEAGYGSSEKCSLERDEGAVPVLRIPNVASERIDLDDLKFALLSMRDRQRLHLAKGDILIVRTNGSLDLVGRSAVIDDLPEPMAFASYMIRLRFDSSTILPTYAQRMLRHLRMSGQLIDFARTTAGQYNVSLGRLRSAEIPVPPLAHQHRIVAELDALQAQVDALKKLQAETAAELDALMPSILDKAFKGYL
jgi:type I restriction enzyme S subunit